MADSATLIDDMAGAILNADEGAPKSLVAGLLTPQQALQVHRNTMRETLSEALQGQFPLAEKFVGPDFLQGLTRAYVRSNPPVSPFLEAFIRGFAPFVKSFEPAQQVPFITDFIALETLVTDVQHRKPEVLVSKVNVPKLAEAGRLRRAYHTEILRSPYPIMTLWMVAQGQLPPEAVQLDAGGETALIAQIDGAVQLLPLDPERDALLRALDEGAGKALSPSEQDHLGDISDWPIFVRSDAVA